MLRNARKANRLVQLCRILLDAEIRFLKPDLLQWGEDDHLDLIVEYVSRQLTGLKITPELETVTSEDLAFQLIELARKSGDVQSVITRYHAANEFATGLRVETDKRGQLRLAEPSVPGLGPVHEEFGRTKARHISLRKQLAERSALKVEFSIAGISSSIGLITAIFVVSGFLYVHYFYRRMGVEISNYFSASDYLSVSVEQIRLGAFSAAMSLVTFSAGVLSGTRRSRLQIKADAKAHTRRRWFWAINTIIAVAASAASIYLDKPSFPLLRVAAFLLCYWAAEYLSEMFFSNRLAAMTAIVGTLLFAANVGLSAYERSEFLLNGHEDDAYVQTLVFKDPSQSIAGELYGANSSYYFVYERSKQSTHVVPRDRVVQIDISKREPKKEPTEPREGKKAVAALSKNS